MISTLRASPWVRQFAKFVVVGCGNVLVSFAVFIFFYRYFPLGTLVLGETGPFGARIESELARLGVHSIDAGLANTIGCVAGMVNSFLMNKHWTFGAKGMTTLQLRRFVVLNIVVITVFAGMDRNHGSGHDGQFSGQQVLDLSGISSLRDNRREGFRRWKHLG
jgi:putative flippase GtrA